MAVECAPAGELSAISTQRTRGEADPRISRSSRVPSIQRVSRNVSRWSTGLPSRGIGHLCGRTSGLTISGWFRDVEMESVRLLRVDQVRVVVALELHGVVPVVASWTR